MKSSKQSNPKHVVRIAPELTIKNSVNGVGIHCMDKNICAYYVRIEWLKNYG